VAVLLTLLWHAVLFTAAELIPPLGTDAWPDTGAIVVNVVAAGVPVVVLWRTGWWRASWLTRLRPRQPWLLAPALGLACLSLLQGVSGSATTLVSSALLFTSVGLSEELLSRGVVQEALAELPPVARVVWVGVLFGCGHLLSGLWFSRPLDDTLVQVVSAGTFGVGYGALRLRTDTLWPLMLLHGLDDWTQVNSPGALPDLVQLAVAVFWVVYGVRLVRAATAMPTRLRTG
jgi:membrane protease YdiL (CAAX protease family)